MGYSRQHLVVFEDSGESRRRHVHVTFRSDPNNKTVLVRLTDDSDLYFLYSTCISVEAFTQIKINQGLLVDFNGFGQKVIDLLAMCLSEEENVNPKYTLKFVRSCIDDQSGQMKIVEATNFKYLTHLSLNLTAADDDTLKTYLVGQLKTLKTDSQGKILELEQTLSATKAQLLSTEQSLTSTKFDFERTRTEAKQREDDLQRNFVNEIKVLEDKILTLEIQHRQNLSHEQTSAEARSEKVRMQMTDEIDKLSTEKQTYIQTNDQLRSTVQNLKSQLKASEEKLKSTSDELEAICSKLAVVEQLKQEQCNTIDRLMFRTSELERELQTKEQLITHTKEQLCTEQSEKSQLQKDLDLQTKELENLEHSSGHNSDEVKKANEIIKHLQAEVKSYHNKAKLRGQVAAEQERLLTSKESELQEKINELNRTRTHLTEATNEVNRLTASFKQTNAELAEAQKTIKTNENIISWLNRQISEKQLGNLQNRLKTTGYSTPHNGFPIQSTSPPQTSDLSQIPPWQPVSSFPKTTALHNVIVSKLQPVLPSTSTTDTCVNTKTYAMRSVLSGQTLKPPSFHTDFSVTPHQFDLKHITQFSRIPTTYSATSALTCQPLPVYVPSNIAVQSTVTHMDNLVPNEQQRRIVQPYTSPLPSTNETDGTINQHSLTSAYFPKQQQQQQQQLTLGAASHS